MDDVNRPYQFIGTRGQNLAAWVLHRCSRITSSGALIPEIDGLRFLAITAVLLYHTSAYTLIKGGARMAKLAEGSLVYSALSQGHYGVQFFFIISGFVLLLPFASSRLLGSPPPTLGAYFKRRVSRLEPPYLINLVVVALLLWTTGRANQLIVPHLLASMAYLHNALYSSPSTINYVAWSLEVEIQFYLVAPVLALVFAIRPRWLRLLAIGCIATAAIWFQRNAGLADGFNVLGNGLNLLGSIQYFLVGALLVDIYLMSWGRAPSTGWLWDALLVGAWGVFLFVSVIHQTVPLGVSLPLIMFVTVVATFRGRRMRTVLSNRWIATIGGMCYTIYLYHYFIISLIGRLLSPRLTIDTFAASVILNSVVLAPVVLVSCAALFAFTERPFMKRDWLARFWSAASRMTSTTTPATPVR